MSWIGPAISVAGGLLGGQTAADAARSAAQSNIEAAKIDQKNQQFIADMAARLTELELKYSQNVPGSIV